MAVELQTEVSQARVLKALEHHFERGHFLANEEDTLAPSNKLRDQICDGLTLARAGRSLNDQVAARLDRFNANKLTAISVSDKKARVGACLLI